VKSGTAVVLLLFVAGCSDRARKPAPQAAAAHYDESDFTAVHASATLIDTHNDVTTETVKGLDLAARRTTGHTDVPRLRAGGVDAVFFAAYVAAEYARRNQAATRAMEMIDTVRSGIVGRNAKHFALATTAEDILQANAQGKIAALIGIEGGHAIEDNLALLRDYYALGVRYMTLTHSNTNNWADSSGDIDNPNVNHHGGLTEFGKQVVAEMNNLGMMVDISHVSDETFWDVLEVSTAPVFASHSSCRALSDIRRNMSDEMIAAMAKKRGVIQINFGCEFISQRSADASSWSNPAIRKKFAALPPAERRKAIRDNDAKMPRATLDEVVAHIDHAVKVGGIDAVGIGSDYDGVTCVPEGLEDVSRFPNLTRALVARGYTTEQIAKIYGGNTLRVMRETARSAGKR
jgi:membrane dipeptidase